MGVSVLLFILYSLISGNALWGVSVLFVIHYSLFFKLLFRHTHFLLRAVGMPDLLFMLFSVCGWLFQIMMPLQWSISCWIIWAVKPEYVPVRRFMLISKYSTSMVSCRSAFLVPSSDRQPSSAS